MRMRLFHILLLSVVLGLPQAEASITIDTYTFDLAQFTGAGVTYRPSPPGTVAFDGKLWDNHVGVDGYTPGELRGLPDPGDQLTLNSTNRTSGTPDWFQLTYAGAGLQIGGSNNDTFVVYEITSSQTAFPVDLEATSWKISFNGLPAVDASAGVSKHLAYTSPVEDVYQISFDLTGFGLNVGDFLKTVYIENKFTGAGTSDPDFIFLGLEGTQGIVPEFSSIATWSVLGMAVSGWAYRNRQNG